MKLYDIEIPQVEIDKLANREKKILYCLYEAYPRFAVVTWTLYKVGGTGFPARKQALNAWLEKYGLEIATENRSSARASFWIYWLQKRGELFNGAPRQFVGETG